MILPNAVFTLEYVQWNDENDSWQVVADSVTNTQTTDSNGMLTFDNLIAGSFYRLTEVTPPEGYASELSPIVISVNGLGLVQEVSSDLTLTDLTGKIISYTGPYSIQVVNQKTGPLPNTGGPGTHTYTQFGLLFLLAAAALYIYKIAFRKEDRRSF